MSSGSGRQVVVLTPKLEISASLSSARKPSPITSENWRSSNDAIPAHLQSGVMIFRRKLSACGHIHRRRSPLTAWFLLATSTIMLIFQADFIEAVGRHEMIRDLLIRSLASLEYVSKGLYLLSTWLLQLFCLLYILIWTNLTLWLITRWSRLVTWRWSKFLGTPLIVYTHLVYLSNPNNSMAETMLSVLQVQIRGIDLTNHDHVLMPTSRLHPRCSTNCQPK